MNGSDIRSLAERAAVLEDRSLDRLVDVHERVAVVRRRRRVTVVAVVAAVILVLAASIALVGVDPTERTPDPAPAPRTDAHRPVEGTCWAVPPAVPVDPDNWHNASPQVPCEEEHTTETVAVWTLSEPTIAAAREKAQELCANQAGAYLGINSDRWIPWGHVALLPSQQQIDDGESWVRCDVMFPSTVQWDAARVTVGSAAGIASDPPAEFWGCLDQPPTTSDQAFVPCDRPHLYEQTGRLAVLAGLSEYPDEQQRRTAEVQCDAGVPDRLAGFQVAAVWAPRSTFVPGGQVTAVCLVHDPDGEPLPARRP